jgi:hypothetical protein
MTTPRPYARVSLTAITILSLALSLGACAGAPSRSAAYGASPTQAATTSFRFDNEARDHVHVYLIGQRREWLLGRVEPGSIATLQVPDDLFDSDPGMVQLAVIAGGGVSQKAALDPRAQLSIAQDASGILSHRWQLAQGQLTSLAVRAAR